MWEVLRLATPDAARRLEADLVFLNGSPLEDVTRVRDVHIVVTNGVAHEVAGLTADVGRAR